MDDEFNMSMRKFLKQVGVTSQQAIEAAMRKAGPSVAGKAMTARVVLTVEGHDIEHVVTGKITGSDRDHGVDGLQPGQHRGEQRNQRHVDDDDLVLGLVGDELDLFGEQPDVQGV